MPRVRAMGGAGISPAAMRRRNVMPSTPMAPDAVAIGSSHVWSRSRTVSGALMEGL